MSIPFVAEIRIFSFNFAPRGWAMCNGQLLPINQNQALFSLLGTTYGGDGRVTFALPDLRGRRPLHPGQGISEGQFAGEEAVTLAAAEIGAHTHLANARSAAGNSPTPQGDVWAGSQSNQYGSPAAVTMDPATIASSGGSSPHDNLSPYLTLNYCIALVGIFPSRN
jgi:microcystin-dependent protein